MIGSMKKGETKSGRGDELGTTGTSRKGPFQVLRRDDYEPGAAFLGPKEPQTAVKKTSERQGGTAFEAGR